MLFGNRREHNAGTVVHDMLLKMKPKDVDRGVQLPASALSIYPSTVLFKNVTGRSVTIFWVNYDGQLVKYQTMTGASGFLCNTFLGHPWIAVDSVTGVQYQIDGKFVFAPEALRTNQSRLRVFITVPMLTLYEYSLGVAVRSINSLQALNDPDCLVDLPRRLVEDIQEAIRKNIFIGKHEFTAFPFYHWFDLGILTV